MLIVALSRILRAYTAITVRNSCESALKKFCHRSAINSVSLIIHTIFSNMSCTIGKKPTPLVGQKGVKYGLQSVFNMDDEEEKEEVYDWRKKVAEEAAKNQRKVCPDFIVIILIFQ